TDPEIFVLIEARGKDAASARWQYAVTRMTSSELHLRLRDKEVWAAEIIRGRQVTDPERPYTTFYFNEVPDFLKEALAKPKPVSRRPARPLTSWAPLPRSTSTSRSPRATWHISV